MAGGGKHSSAAAIEHTASPAQIGRRASTSGTAGMFKTPRRSQFFWRRLVAQGALCKPLRQLTKAIPAIGPCQQNPHSFNPLHRSRSAVEKALSTACRAAHSTGAENDVITEGWRRASPPFWMPLSKTTSCVKRLPPLRRRNVPRQ